MNEDEPVTDDERLEAIEEKISELYQKVGRLEGVTDQLSERIRTHGHRMNTMQYGKYGPKNDRKE